MSQTQSDVYPEYTTAQWAKDKILVARLIKAKKYKQAYDFIFDISMVIDNAKITDYINGMLFVLDLIMEKSSK